LSPSTTSFSTPSPSDPGDLHLVAIPGPHLDAALEVVDFDGAARIKRARLVDGRRCR
jgi:hypothetical protein